MEGSYVAGNGAHFTVWREAGGDLWLSPDDSAAFEALNGTDSVPARTWAREATTALVDSLARSGCIDRRPTRRPNTPQVFRGEWEDHYCRLTRELGSRQSHQVLGTTRLPWSRSSNPRILVFSRLRFAQGERMVTWLWSGDELIESWIDQRVVHPQSIPLAFQRERTFVTFDWFTGTAANVTLEAGGRLRLSNLTR